MYVRVGKENMVREYTLSDCEFREREREREAKVEREI